ANWNGARGATASSATNGGVRNSRKTAGLEHGQAPRHGNFNSSRVGQADATSPLNQVADSAGEQHQCENPNVGLERPFLKGRQKLSLTSPWNVRCSKGPVEPVGLPRHNIGNFAAGFCETKQRQYGQEQGDAKENRHNPRVPRPQPKPEVQANATMHPGNDDQ